MGSGSGPAGAAGLRGAGGGPRVLVAVGERLSAHAAHRGPDDAGRGGAADQPGGTRHGGAAAGAAAAGPGGADARLHRPAVRRPACAGRRCRVPRPGRAATACAVGGGGGAGGLAAGAAWERRFTRLDETVALWRQLWAAPEGGGSFQGSLLRFEELPPMTAPSRPGGPPVWLGGASESALRRVGRYYDGWMPYPPSA